LLILIVLVPINFLLRKRPEDIGLRPDGDAEPLHTAIARPSNIVDPAWTSVEWTVRRALRTARFWWLALGYFCALYAWYAVQVHQTKYLQEIGFSANRSAWALGLVSLIGVAGQISLGHVSDRIGREWIWAISNLGFVICFLALIVLQHDQSMIWLYLMVAAQGGLGYGLTSVMGAMVAEIFQGRHFGGIFGTVMLSAMAGGAAGPWVTGVLHDATGNYTLAFWLGAGVSVVSGLAIWQASPRKIRAVAGRIRAA
jgi:MFS family permease